MVKYSIIMSCHNNFELTRDAIISLDEKNTSKSVELLVTNDGSTDETKVMLDAMKSIVKIPFKIIHNENNIGVPKSMNNMLKMAKGKYILRTDNDIIMQTKGYLDKMQFWFEFVKKKGKELGALSCITDHSTGKAAHKSIKDVKKAFFFEMEINGYCQMLLKKAVEQVGYIDEKFPKVYGEDRDLVYRLMVQGYEIGYCHDVFVNHIGRTTFPPNTVEGKLAWISSNKRMREKWEIKK